jgi:hypothetical protein
MNADRKTTADELWERVKASKIDGWRNAAAAFSEI